MEKLIWNFSVKYLQILNEEGVCDKKLMPKLNNSDVKRFYEQMVLTRAFDEKAVKLQRQGRMGTYASVKGQEASQIGSALAMGNADLAFPSFRENGVYIARAMPLEKLYLYWIGDERGMETPKNVNVFPLTIPVGTHIPHAVGAAMAMQYKKKKAATLVYFGDGATSTGDFHEAMNFAGTFMAPVVFICQNNQYAISLPVKEQTKSKTLAQKAIAYGFEGIQVDGNDVFAVYKATQYALQKAKSGKGPTLIECFTYRLSDHTTSDDAKKYREESEVKRWVSKDPILRLKKYMTNNKIFSSNYEKYVKVKAEKVVYQAVKKAESTKRIEPEEIFNYMYKTLTPNLEEQQRKIK